jgi:hypothetical protein
MIHRLVASFIGVSGIDKDSPSESSHRLPDLS